MVKKLKIREIPVLFFVLIIFAIVIIGRYRLLPQIINTIKNYQDEKKKITWNYSCKNNETKIAVIDGTVCKDNNLASSDETKIFETYQLKPNGKEYIYQFLNNGDIKIADDYLNDLHYVDRFKSVKITPPISWQEDPYGDKYWRFIFYGLRSTENLVYAWEQTGNVAYENKLAEILNSFMDVGINQQHAWDDNHSVAFRTMVLVNIWWRLRETNGLSENLSSKILVALKRHGDFLADRNHYEPQYNHGINEAAALLLLAKSFPDLDKSNTWLKIAEDRLNTSVITAVDSDGVLVENSPYYHFYALEKYWEIYKYVKKFDPIVSKNFEQRINKMIDYAVYILQPNQEVPLLGASLYRKVRNTGIDSEISSINKNFLYVLTRGKQGTKPNNLSIHYPIAGQTILRSGWTGEGGYLDQTQLIFDVGPFRTLHSHLDALSFSLYGNGIALMPDSGLYTYEIGPYKNYFNGTYAHNTVVVDGQDQKEGTAISGSFIQGNGFSYQTGEHDLYDGVSHDRAITLLGKNLVLVIDNLYSQSTHNYEQMFHLFPGAKLNKSNLDIDGVGISDSQSIHIRQIVSNGITVSSYINENNPIRGVCSLEYGKLIPCYMVSYLQKGKNVSYYTLLEIGKKNANLTYSISNDKNSINISDGNKEYSVKISHTKKIDEKVLVAKNDVPAIKSKIIDNFTDIDKFTTKKITNDGEEIFTVGKEVSYKDRALNIATDRDGYWIEVSKNIQMDLSNKNLLIKMNVNNAESATGIEIGLSSNNWEGYVVNRIDNSYRPEYSGEWLSVSLGKGEFRDRGGQWSSYGQGFDWGNITNIRFRIRAEIGKMATLKISNISYIPEQNIGQVIIIFDDGYASILPASDILNGMKIKANVAVIGSSTDKRNKSRLSLNDIKHLQDDYGWSIVNHSWFHKDALATYYVTNKMNDLESDILSGAKYLEDNGISTDPNWYIYPHGETNQAVIDIIGKYYKFARTIQNSPEVYPFGDNLKVKSFSVQNDTPPEAVIGAIKDTKKYKLTLFLTFHRIQSNSTDRLGYSIEDFATIINYLKNNNISVKTLKELDESNGISIRKINFISGKPEQISLRISVKSGLLMSVESIITMISKTFYNIYDAIFKIR